MTQEGFHATLTDDEDDHGQAQPQLASAFCDGPECVAPEPLERDPLLSELQARVAEMEADCGAPSRRTLALRRGVETCFETVHPRAACARFYPL